MAYLIDTHVCLWAISDKEKLSVKVNNILENPNEKIFVSTVSLFEIAIKLKIGKLPDFNVTIAEFIESITATGIEILPIKHDHIIKYSSFTFSSDHRDPFDRLILATAASEGTA